MKALYNPLSSDFSYEILDDDNVSHLLTIPSREIKYFNNFEFQFMKKHLIDEIKNERGIGLITEKEQSEIEKEVEVQL